MIRLPGAPSWSTPYPQYRNIWYSCAFISAAHTDLPYSQSKTFPDQIVQQRKTLINSRAACTPRQQHLQVRNLLERLLSKPLWVCYFYSLKLKCHESFNHWDKTWCTVDPILPHTSARLWLGSCQPGKSPAWCSTPSLTFDVPLPTWMSHGANTGVDSISHPERCVCVCVTGGMAAGAACLSGWQLYDHWLLFKVRQNKAGKKKQDGKEWRGWSPAGSGKGSQREGANKVKKNNNNHPQGESLSSGCR